MQIFLINLDRHPLRLKRMESQLQGLPFKRIAAVDGKTVDGPEQRDRSRPPSCENLSRYGKACALSHRVAWREFLAGPEKFACVLEDDVYLSPDFTRFIRDESWIPAGCNLLKLETNLHKVFLSRKTICCLDRSVAILHSLHLGTAAYIVSRKGAADLLQRTQVLDCPTDWLVFGEETLRRQHPVYQLIPGLCVQGARIPNGIAFSEMQSAIQPVRHAPPRKTVLKKIQLEITRPFLQLSAWPWIRLREWRLRARRGMVPFA
jgi:glycosyl transferase family 25